MKNNCEPIYDEGGIVIYNRDSLDLMRGIERPAMIFADPPYFLSNGGTTCRGGKRVSVDKGEWDRGSNNMDDYNRVWLSACARIIRSSGTIWVCGTYHNIFSVGAVMNALGFKILNVVTWKKPNPPPNLGRRTLTHSTEFIIWALPPGAFGKYTFNYALLREMNFGRQMKDVWEITSAPARERIHGSHPTQKPLELVEMCIRACTGSGELVFDPFGGSGTTAVACKRLDRRCIISEINPSYAEISAKRVRAEDQNRGRLYAKGGI